MAMASNISHGADPDAEPLPGSTGTSHLSYVTAFQSQALSAASFNPTSTLSRDLADIFTTLLQQNIPGPTLVRLRTEFNRVLGRGRQFEVLGASPEFESFCSRISVEPESCAAQLVQDQQCYAIKYALPPSASVSQNSSANSSFRDAGSRSFAAQLHSAKVEIQKLCLPSLRGHANIVRLLRWGICLDTLEDPTAQIPRIPLLILERATTDLQRFMRQLAPERLSFDTRSEICLGVGHGLSALHAEGIYHGDLKLENVLMFQHEGRRWVAKLCDFGLSGTVDNGSLEYRGTDGWRPPESFDGSKLQSVMVIKCDIFVYGLLVWAVFTGKCDSPLRSLDLHGKADPERFVLAASGQLVRLQQVTNRTNQEGSVVEERQNYRILQLFRACLVSAPELRSRSPWRYLDTSVNQIGTCGSKENGITSISTGESLHSHLSNNLLSLWRKIAATFGFGEDSLTLPVVQVEIQRGLDLKPDQEVTSSPSPDRIKGNFQKGGLISGLGRVFKLSPTRTIYHQKCIEIFEFYANLWNIDGEADSIQPIQHPTEGHLSLGRLRGRLTKLVLWSSMQRDRWQLQSSIPGFGVMNVDVESRVAELYALARIRSRCSKCCWDEALLQPRKWHAINLLVPIFSDPGTLSFERHSIHPMFRFRDPRILPWLLRGEIGRNELSLLRDEPETLWHFTYSTAITASNRVALMVLLLENGCHIEDTFETPGGEPKTAFRLFLESLPTSGMKDASCAEELCCHFKRIAANTNTPSNTRAFLTGASHLLIDDGNIGENDVATTALHDAVVANRYLAVECLVRSGFVVDALDHRGLNTFALANSFHTLLSPPAEKRENDRIVVFLQQGMGMRQRKGPNGSWDLPRGWEPVGMDTTPKSNETSGKTINSPIDLGSPPYIRHQSPEESSSAHHFNNPTATQPIRDLRQIFFQERHTDSITSKRPKVSIIEDRRLSLGFQAITGTRKVIGSENQVYGLDLIPFFNRNASRNTNDNIATVSGDKDVASIHGALSQSALKLRNEPMYGDDWYSADILRLQGMVVEPYFTVLLRLCLSPMYRLVLMLPKFSSDFSGRFQVSWPALAIEIVLESLLMVASVATERQTFAPVLDYLIQRLKSFMQNVFFSAVRLYVGVSKRLYPFPEFSFLFRTLLQHVINSLRRVSMPVLLFLEEFLMTLLFRVFFYTSLFGVVLQPLYLRIAPYISPLLGFVGSLIEFAAPVLSSAYLWLSMPLVLMILALEMHCPQTLLFGLSVAGLILFPVLLLSYLVKIFDANEVDHSYSFSICTWPGCLIELTVSTSFCC